MLGKAAVSQGVPTGEEVGIIGAALNA